MSRQIIASYLWESPELNKVRYQLSCGHAIVFDTSVPDHATEMCELVNGRETIECHLCEQNIRFVDPLDLRPGEDCIVYLKPGNLFATRKGEFVGFVDGRRVKFRGVTGATWVVDDRAISKVEVVR